MKITTVVILTTLLLLLTPSTGYADRFKSVETSIDKAGLKLMQNIWKQAAVYYGRKENSLMPRVVFTDAAIVGTVWNSNKYKIATRQVLWPDWVNRIFIDHPSSKTKKFRREVGIYTQSDMLAMLLHEWAHYFQITSLNDEEAEGGAQLFVRRVAPQIFKNLSIPYTQLTFSEDQYPEYMKLVKRYGNNWILFQQFGIQDKIIN